MSQEQTSGTAGVDAPKPRKKKSTLPPLSSSMPTTDGTEQTTKPRKKKRPKSEFPLPTGDSENVVNTIDNAKPKKKKKPKPATTSESPLHDPGAGISTENLIKDDQTVKKKKGRKPATEAATPVEGRTSPEGEETVRNETTTSSPVARHIDVRGMPLAEALQKVKAEDISEKTAVSSEVKQEGDEKEEDEEQFVGEVVGGGLSAKADKIFFQTQDTRFFKEEPREVYQARQRKEKLEREKYLLGEDGVVDTSNRTLKFAVNFTKGFNYVGTLLIGALSGVSLMHTIYVWGLATNYLGFLADYTSYAQPMSLVYYIGITLIALSILERYDYGRLEAKAWLECFSFKHAGMIIILLLPCYVISNILTPTALWMHRFSNNATLYQSVANGDSIVQNWKILDSVRCACLVIMWMVIAFNPDFNKLSINLQSELDEEENEEMQVLQLRNSPSKV